MAEFYINEPVWSENAVGLSRKEILRRSGDVTVEILYRDTDGNRLYPGVYKVDRGVALRCPLKSVRSRVSLHMVPIGILTPETEDERLEREIRAIQ